MNSRSEAFLQDFKAHFGGSLKRIVDESPLRLLGIAEGHYDLYPLQYNSVKMKFSGYIAKTNFELDSVDLT